MAIKSEVFAKCVEVIRVEVARRVIGDCLGVSCGLCNKALSALMGLPSDCVDGEGARYRMAFGAV